MTGLKADGKTVMLISLAEIRCLAPEAGVSYLILSSSAFFSSVSLLSTVMMAPCSSSVRWLRSIMAPPTRPASSLSRKVQKRSVAGNGDQPSSLLVDKNKSKSFFLDYIKQILHFDINIEIFLNP